MHKSSRKPGEESIVQVDPDEDLSDYSNEYRIKQNILRIYDKTTRPVRNDTTQITLYVGMSLFHILDTVYIHTRTAADNVLVYARFWKYVHSFLLLLVTILVAKTVKKIALFVVWFKPSGITFVVSRQILPSV